jgi:hypothetical protein
LPYLDSKIAIEFHKDNCPDPEARRLYIRGPNKKGNQHFIPWGLTCQNCAEIWRQAYRHNPTKIQKDKQIEDDNNDHNKAESESKEEIERKHAQFITQKKLRLIKYKNKELDDIPVNRKEEAYRKKIKALNGMYKNDIKHCKPLKDHIKWNEKLVERFLAVRPTYWEIDEILNWPPLRRNNNRYANLNRGYIPNPKNWGYLKHDKHDPDIIGEFEKLIIEEAKGRMQTMEDIIKKYHELEKYKTVE